MATKLCSRKDVLAPIVETGYRAYDPLADQAVAQASALIRRFTRRDWDYGQFIDFLDSTDIDIAIRRGKNTLILPLREKNIDLTMPVDVRYNTGGNWQNSDAMSADSFQVDTRKNQIVFYPSRMTSNARAIRVVYYAGYKVIPQPQIPDPENPGQTIPDPEWESGVLDIPDHIKYAAIAQAQFFVRQAMNDVTGTTRKDSEERTKTLKLTASGLVGEALSLLKSETRLLMGGIT